MSSTKSPSAHARRLLETAADRPGYSILPVAPDVPVRGAARQRLLAGLLQQGLLAEVTAADAASAWRTDETGRGVALCVTAQGLAAISRTPAPARKVRARRPAPEMASATAPGAPLPPTEAAVPGSASSSDVPPVPLSQPNARADAQPGGKLGRVLAALASEAGAALPELVALTGWQPHTTRAALTRLRQRGYALERLQLNGRVAYRLGAAG